MTRLLFYFQYAARNLWRNRRWSTFALFSVAAGVATVVALRSLGLAIGDSLTSSVRASNHGDINISLSQGGFLSFQDPQEQDGFSEAQLTQIAERVAQLGGSLSAYSESSNIQVTALDFSTAGRPQFITSYFIDPLTYPPTSDIRAVQPAGVALGDLFHGGNEIVISENLAQTQGIEVGETVRVSGTTEEYTVRGIVPASAEAGLRNIFAAFFGFAYFGEGQKSVLPVNPRPNRIAIMLPDGTTPEQIQDAAYAEDGFQRLSSFAQIDTVPDLIEENQQIADVLGSFIVVMGLGALLIGGVGIMNTMLVMVRRRTEEIAALKTFGLKGRQVALLFMSESLLLGFVGSAVGIFFGIVLSALANAYGQQLIQQPLAWRIYPEAVLFGLLLGLVITAVFGVAPVLTAVRIRPAIILRPNETVIPRLGCLQSIGLILLVVLVIGLIAGQMLRPSFEVATQPPTSAFITGVVGVALTLLILGILVGILWILVWLIGKLPAFGWIDMRLALRNLTTHRTRTATTLLALSAGMFALSSIAFFGAGVREIINFSLSNSLGGNVLIFSILPTTLVDARLNTLDGVEYRTRLTTTSGELTTINGQPVPEPTPDETFGSGFNDDDDFGGFNFGGNFVSLLARDTTNPNPTTSLIAGRGLTAEDRGKPVAVYTEDPRFAGLGIGIGSTVTITVNERAYDLEIVGITPANNGGGFSFGGFSSNLEIPPDVIVGGNGAFPFTIAQVQAEKLNTVLLDLSSLPLVYSIDITFIDSFLSRFIEQMSAIPILVGILSLGAAAVIMANTVALSTLERRRQIGILKAVGLKGRRVLRVLLLENTLVSLLGGVLGIGLSAIGVALMSSLGISIPLLIPGAAIPVVVLLVLTAVAIAWAATYLSARAVTNERVRNVLRYE